MKGFPDLPPLWWLGSILVIYGARALFPGLHAPGPLLDLVSWALLIAALGLIGWSAMWFFRKKTPIEPHHTPLALVVEGPYRFSRNPIYLALVLLTLGSALGHGSPVGVIAAAALAWILHNRFVLPEESGLRDAFGAEADVYFDSTSRWL